MNNLKKNAVALTEKSEKNISEAASNLGIRSIQPLNFYFQKNVSDEYRHCTHN